MCRFLYNQMADSGSTCKSNIGFWSPLVLPQLSFRNRARYMKSKTVFYAPKNTLCHL